MIEIKLSGLLTGKVSIAFYNVNLVRLFMYFVKVNYELIAQH